MIGKLTPFCLKKYGKPYGKLSGFPWNFSFGMPVSGVPYWNV
jgi:hypothetical protein